MKRNSENEPRSSAKMDLSFPQRAASRRTNIDEYIWFRLFERLISLYSFKMCVCVREREGEKVDGDRGESVCESFLMSPGQFYILFYDFKNRSYRCFLIVINIVKISMK